MNPLLKVVLVGDSGSGKTSLLTQFISKQFREKYKATIGSDFLTREIMIGDRLVTLQLWDTAGQERFNSLGTAFFRGSDVCILVFDITRADSLEHMARWKADFLREASVEDPEFPFVCIANKTDIAEKRFLDSGKCRDRCINDIGAVSYFEASAKTGENVEKAFITAATFVLNRAQLQAKATQTQPQPPPAVVELTGLKPNTRDGSSSCCS